MNTPEDEKRLHLLVRHVQHVEDNCRTIAESLIDNNELELARKLIHNGRLHDASKFDGFEWEHLWPGDPYLIEAINRHSTTNAHHPEYWNGIHNMPRLFVAELVADWSARSSELQGKGLIPWIEEDATRRFKFNGHDRVHSQIYEFINMLLEPAFK